MEIYKKLKQARDFIKQLDLKKAGRNAFSKYDYYTPEQVSNIVTKASSESNILTVFNLKSDEYGYYGELNVIDLDTNSSLTFVQRTDIPSIKATNISQQIGGCVTYTHRYMLMTAFDIVDNNLDFDTPQAKTEPKKTWLSDNQYNGLLSLSKEDKKKYLDYYDNKTLRETKDGNFIFCMKKEYREKLNELIK